MTWLIGEMAVAMSSSLVLSLVVKATVVSAGALTAAYLARRSRASVRHLLVATGFILLLTLPVVSIALPPREVRVPIAHAGPTALPSTVVTETPIVPASGSVDNGGAPTERLATEPSVSAMLWAIWLTGVTVVVAPLIAGVVRIRRLRRNGVPWRVGRALVAELAVSLEVRKRIQVVLDETVVGPMTCGVVRPVIVLPRDARDWDREDLRRAVVHELEHIQRRDWLILCLARLVCAMYWFHPLVWMAWRQLRLEAEKACDDAVLRAAVPESYADQLVTLAERVVTNVTQPLLAMANRGDLFARVAAVLDERQARGRAGTRWIVTSGLSGVLLLVGIAPIRAVVTPPAIQPPPAVVDGYRPEASTLETPLVAVTSPAPETAHRPPIAARLTVAAASATAQEPAQPRAPTDVSTLPRFEVVSVKVNNSGAAFPGIPRLTPGRATITNISVRQLIQVSHGIPPYRLVGLPEWADSARFDITATSNENATPAELLVMVRGLLADRFQFSTRQETRQLETYSLVERARGSAKLKKSEADCAAQANAPLDQTSNAGRVGAGDGQPRCQLLPMTGRGRLVATGVALRDIANVLTQVVGRMVVDKTGLSGPFDVNLAWTPDPALQAVIRQNDSLSVQDAPSIFTAVEEQLGLRLVSDRGPVEVMVVERLERPTPD